MNDDFILKDVDPRLTPKEYTDTPKRNRRESLPPTESKFKEKIEEPYEEC